MREQYWHDRGQEWVVCPKCRSEEAGIIHWMLDGEITLVCPVCDEKEYGVEGTGKEITEVVYGE